MCAVTGTGTKQGNAVKKTAYNPSNVRGNLIPVYNKLLEEKDKILASVKKDAGEVLTKNRTPCENERSKIHADNMMANSLDNAKRERLAKIDEAIERMESGWAGVCADCGEPIRPKRLELVPETKYCVDCAPAHVNRVMVY